MRVAPEVRPTSEVCEPLRRAAGEPRPNLVLIVACSFRAGHMSGAGYERPTTPFLDALAGRGLRFTEAMSAASWTKPASATLLTGLTPGVHGLIDYYDLGEVRRGKVVEKRVLADEVGTLAECLQDVGYRTAGRSNNIHVSEFFNLQQGFEDFVADRYMTTEGMVGELERFLAEGRESGDDRPFFYLMLSRDAHITYRPRYEYYQAFNRVAPEVGPEEYGDYTRKLWTDVRERVQSETRVSEELRMRFIDLYDGEMRQLDDALSRIPAVLARAGVA